jgi:hypothetical protein
MTDTNATRHPTPHTPGPWHHDWRFIIAPDPNGVHPDIYIAEIAETDDEGRVAPPEQQWANARLLAAAPELLDSVRSLWDALSGILEGIPLCDAGFDRERQAALSAIAEASAAVAYATAA